MIYYRNAFWLETVCFLENQYLSHSQTIKSRRKNHPKNQKWLHRKEFRQIFQDLIKIQEFHHRIDQSGRGSKFIYTWNIWVKFTFSNFSKFEDQYDFVQLGFRWETTVHMYLHTWDMYWDIYIELTVTIPFQHFLTFYFHSLILPNYSSPVINEIQKNTRITPLKSNSVPASLYGSTPLTRKESIKVWVWKLYDHQKRSPKPILRSWKSYNSSKIIILLSLKT